MPKISSVINLGARFWSLGVWYPSWCWNEAIHVQVCENSHTVGVRFLTPTSPSSVLATALVNHKGLTPLSLPKALSSYSTWMFPYSKQVHHSCQLDCRLVDALREGTPRGLVSLLSAPSAQLWAGQVLRKGPTSECLIRSVASALVHFLPHPYIPMESCQV